MIFMVFFAIIIIILYLVALLSPHFAEKQADKKAEKLKASYTVVWQGFLTQLSAKFAEKTCVIEILNRL